MGSRNHGDNIMQKWMILWFCTNKYRLRDDPPPPEFCVLMLKSVRCKLC